MVNKKTKLFVLDTNVLLHDPSCLYRFEEHDIYLPMVTLEELDNIKKIIKHEMEIAMPLKVPVVAEAGNGNNWLEAH